MSFRDVDVSIPEDDKIRAAHPTRTGRHDLYQEATRMVGAKHSKAALVELVNWLLKKNDDHIVYVRQLERDYAECNQERLDLKKRLAKAENGK